MSDLKDDTQATLDLHTMEFVLGQHWKHYKGGCYEIIASEDNLKPMVGCRSFDHGTIWIRIVSNFVT